MLRALIWTGLALGLAAAPARAQRAALSDAAVRAVVDHVAGAVIAPTYGAVAQEAAGLQSAVDALAAAPSEAALEAARCAWRRARAPWEQAEAFLFGPVDLGRYDPTLDSWPLNTVDLDALLGSDLALTPDVLAGLNDGVRGFHAVEYLLWGVSGARTADSLSVRDLAYLQITAADMAAAAAGLHDAWARPGGYADVLRAAGTSDAALYASLDDALYELLMGVLFIVDEVAAEKLRDPLAGRNGRFAESRFSGTSKQDVLDNLGSVRHVYTGTYGATTGPGLGALVAALDPALDVRFRRQLGAAAEAVEAIPGPLRQAVVDHPETVEAAQAAVLALQATLEDALIARLAR